VGLTSGTGPLSPWRAGTLNFQPPDRAVYVEPSPRRVRGLRGGVTVVDSLAVKLAFESGRLPVWFFPAGDVEGSVAVARRGEDVHESLAGHVEVAWDAVERWMEEDEEVFVHPRDPYHRVDVVRSSRRVRVSMEGEVLAETTRPLALFETGLPTRWYIPPGDVRDEPMEPCPELVTACPYKGVADYRSARVGERFEHGLLWRYADPIPETARIAGMWCFYGERVELEVLGGR
jgi:uncharacterized protein (DUF427 family)